MTFQFALPSPYQIKLSGVEHFIYPSQRLLRIDRSLQAHRNPGLRPKSPKLKPNQTKENEKAHHRHEKKARPNAIRQHAPLSEKRSKATQHEKKPKSILKVNNGQNKRIDPRQVNLKMVEPNKRSVKFNYHAMLRRFASELSNPFEGVVYDDRMVPVRQEERSPGRLMAKARKNRQATCEILCPEKHLERHEPLYRIPNNAVPCSVSSSLSANPSFVSSRESARLLTMLHRIECRRQRCCRNKRIPRAVKGGVPHGLAISSASGRINGGPTVVVINECLANSATAAVVTLDDLPDECLVLPILPKEHNQQDSPAIDEALEKWLNGAKIEDLVEISVNAAKIIECKTIN